MIELSNVDFMLIKWMISSTGFIDDKNKLIKIRNFQELKDTLKVDPLLGEKEQIKIINEVLYFINFKTILHKNNACLENYECKLSELFISKEIILLVLLYQDLIENEFDDLLKCCLNETLGRFKSLEIDFQDINGDEMEPLIKDFLDKHHENLIGKYGPMLGSNTAIPALDSPKYQGLCLVINNEKFADKYDKREGTLKDAQTIMDTFTSLGYQIEIEPNVPFDCMKKVINDTKSKFKNVHRKLVVFVLSHGEEKGIVTTDEKLFPFEDVITPFQDLYHIELRKRQKLFFFVCCRGNNEDRGFRIEHDGLGDASTNGNSTIPAGGVSSDLQIEPVDLPECGNVFIGYSAYKCYRSYRDKINGTIFINSLCKQIMADPTRNILDIFQDVQSEVPAKIYSEIGVYQVPVMKSSLTSKCFLVN